MGNIGEFVRRMVDEREPREPDDLVNGPHKLCECGDGRCGNPTPVEPRYLREA